MCVLLLIDPSSSCVCSACGFFFLVLRAFCQERLRRSLWRRIFSCFVAAARACVRDGGRGDGSRSPKTLAANLNDHGRNHRRSLFIDITFSITPSPRIPLLFTMFEARLTQGRIFKALIESIKDLVQDANIDCSEDELSIQAMDSSHVSLVAVTLRSSGFDHFRCDRPISLGFNSANMSKILKCAGNDDVVTLKAEDEGDTLTLMFESEGQDRIADFGTCRLFISLICLNCGR